MSTQPFVPGNDIEDVAWNGIQTEVFLYEEAKALFQVVGTNAATLNASRFGNLGGTLQRQWSRQALLAVAHMYDEPLTGDERSLVRMKTLLGRAANTNPVPTSAALNAKLSAAGANRAAACDVAWSAVQCWLSDAIKAQKQTVQAVEFERNKAIAHNAQVPVQVPGLMLPAWTDLDRAVRVGVGLLDLLGLVLPGQCLVVQGEPLATGDAHRSAIAMGALLRQAGLAPAGQPTRPTSVVSPFPP